MSDEMEDVPGTEPVLTGTAPKRRGRPPKKKGVLIQGSELAPRIDFDSKGVHKQYFYWIGVLPHCPIQNVIVGAICFSKITAILVKDPTGTKRPQGAIGKVQNLDLWRFLRVKDRLARTVIRIHEPGPSLEEMAQIEMALDGTTLNRGKAELIKIPSDDYIEEMKRQGRPARKYTPDPRDEPIAKYLYAQLCEDQNNPRRGSVYPGSLYETGLFWPEDSLE